MNMAKEETDAEVKDLCLDLSARELQLVTGEGWDEFFGKAKKSLTAVFDVAIEGANTQAPDNGRQKELNDLPSHSWGDIGRMTT